MDLGHGKPTKQLLAHFELGRNNKGNDRSLKKLFLANKYPCEYHRGFIEISMAKMHPNIRALRL